MTEGQKKDIDNAEKSGIPPKARMKLFSRETGGGRMLVFIKDDYKNYLRTKRMIELKTGDTGGVLEYLQGRQVNDPDFTYAIQVDMDDQVTNIFWADARMKIDYGHFGDVVCFDTTYKKNKGRPFGFFVGVNHHKQTVIYGAALMYDETAESFEWLFKSFANAMSRDEPVTILTNENPAMAKAIASSWPKTYHRLCVGTCIKMQQNTLDMFLITSKLLPRISVTVYMTMTRLMTSAVLGMRCLISTTCKIMNG